MRIAYFAHVNGGSRPGVLRKIAGQIGQWRAEGHVVRMFALTRDEAAEWQSAIRDVVVGRYVVATSRLSAVTTLVRAMRRFGPAIVHLRRDLFCPQTLLLPAKAALIVEVNEDDLSEYALGSRLRAWCNARTRGIILRRARALVFVTNELSVHSAFHSYCAMRAVVTNGIDLNSYPSFPSPWVSILGSSSSAPRGNPGTASTS